MILPPAPALLVPLLLLELIMKEPSLDPPVLPPRLVAVAELDAVPILPPRDPPFEGVVAEEAEEANEDPGFSALLRSNSKASISAISGINLLLSRK
jgi:hypothetical protein